MVQIPGMVRFSAGEFGRVPVYLSQSEIPGESLLSLVMDAFLIGLANIRAALATASGRSCSKRPVVRPIPAGCVESESQHLQDFYGPKRTSRKEYLLREKEILFL